MLQSFHLQSHAFFSFDGVKRTPKMAVSDFERAIHLALVKVWPDIQCSGCNFHYCQALGRKARKLGVLVGDIDYRKISHKGLLMFMRLSLLPLDRIDAGIEACYLFLRANDLNTSFEPFVAYFKRTWLESYPKELWCVSDRERRTNNNVEGYNNYLKHRIPLDPHPWVFAARLFDVAVDATATFDYEVNNNVPPPPDRSKMSIPLASALEALREGRIVEIEFLHLLLKP